MYIACGHHNGPLCQGGYVSFYLNREFYKLNLTAFNSMLGFPLSMDLLYRHVPKEFYLNVFWNETSGDYPYDTRNSKDTVIRNLYIRVAQRLLTNGLFAREHSLNVSHLSDLYFLCSMLQGG